MMIEIEIPLTIQVQNNPSGMNTEQLTRKYFAQVLRLKATHFTTHGHLQWLKSFWMGLRCGNFSSAEIFSLFLPSWINLKWRRFTNSISWTLKCLATIITCFSTWRKMTKVEKGKGIFFPCRFFSVQFLSSLYNDVSDMLNTA